MIMFWQHTGDIDLSVIVTTKTTQSIHTERSCSSRIKSMSRLRSARLYQRKQTT
nr:hypothetical protein [Cressdnaviricota sp.]